MTEYPCHDITSVSFEEFIAFLFEHDVVPIPTDKNRSGPWYWSVEVKFDPIEIARYYIQLFNQPEFLLTRFSRDQLEQGFWAIQSGNLDCSVSEIIWDRRIPFGVRETCVRAMYSLFAHLFMKDAFDTSVEMWWDSLAFGYDAETRARSKGGEDAMMQDVMFQTLIKVLDLPAQHCQYAALHGLGHLMHPDTLRVIQDFIGKNPSIDPELREYAEAAARHEVM